jgi:hypothetical protein
VSFETERDVIRQRLASSWGSTTAIALDGFNLGTYAVQERVAVLVPGLVALAGRPVDLDEQRGVVPEAARRQNNHNKLQLTILNTQPNKQHTNSSYHSTSQQLQYKTLYSTQN